MHKEEVTMNARHASTPHGTCNDKYVGVDDSGQQKDQHVSRDVSHVGSGRHGGRRT